MKQIEGKAWVFGDKIDTDLLAPGAYMRAPMAELAKHCLEAVSPHFAVNVKQGDIVLGGSGFGMGSSREQAVQALMELGIGAVIAKSFARIFYRNALNLGLPVLVCPDIHDINNGHTLSLDISSGIITNQSTGRSVQCEPIPPFLIKLIEDGGLLLSLQKRFAATPNL
ncbi:MAG: 3-isopropylmalate/(R)-2-methylmalate dehydratase small subunit [Kiritimatiellia bacterium]|jgi:3-isopropylmalate/(R)-2-methylmalate dehydratase small subunit